MDVRHRRRAMQHGFTVDRKKLVEIKVTLQQVQNGLDS